MLIINRGRIEASDAPENLRARLGATGDVRVELKAPDADHARKALLDLPGVKTAEAAEDGEWAIFTLGVEPGADPREAIHRLTIERRWNLRELSRERVTLEDVFADLTHPDE